jgi:aryl-alcohol dehydrogenase-like predicted oxidoreductase
MRYRLLGCTGLRVSEICLGAMTFGDEGNEGWGATREEGRRIFDVFTESGGNFFDTANNYVGGMSERYLGELIARERDRYVVATKYTAYLRPGDPNSGGNHRKSLIQALDGSLARLQTDYIDLYWVHVWDPLTPTEELMRALDDQVRAGKVLYVGMSDAPAWTVARANTLAEARGWSPFAAIQIAYSLIERSAERELIPMANALDLSVLAWAPLERGFLSGKYTAAGVRQGEQGRLAPNDPRINERNLAIAAAVAQVADELGVAPASVAIAWLLSRSRPAPIPIVGARTAQQLQETLGCLDIEFHDEALERLSDLSAISLGFPHDFLAGLYARRSVTQGFIDTDRWPASSAPDGNATDRSRDVRVGE